MPLGSSFLNRLLPIGPSLHAPQRLDRGEDVGQVEGLEFLDAERAELADRRRQHLDGAELERFELFLVLVELAVGIDLDLDAAVRALLGELLEFLGGLALGRVQCHDVAELDDDRIVCPGWRGRQASHHAGNNPRESHRILSSR